MVNEIHDSDMKTLDRLPKSFKLFLTVLSLISFQDCFSQECRVSTTIVSPLQITKTADLSFGKLVAGSQNGSVSIGVNNVRTARGGVQLISSAENSNSAGFDIVGYPNATFTISMPSQVVISQGIHNMKVENFVSSIGNTSTLDTRGVAALKVGATLNVNANQPIGIYTGAFDVTVAYN